MSKVDDGGPAFPFVAEGGAMSGLHPEISVGMSLRDYFAAHALGLLLAFPEPDPTGASELTIGPGIDAIATHYAKVSYIYADAMLTARKEGQGGGA
jgi:hypothetical protein